MGRNGNHIETVDSDENKLCEVSKHTFGLASMYISTAIGVVGSLGLIFLLLPSFVDDTERAFNIALLLGFFLIIGGVLIMFLATAVYRQNRLIVTDRNITQILQYSLFSRKVSQLNMVNVEDVTSMQSGIFSTVFGYGELRIETAGEQSNFSFPLCPRPGYYAKIILEAREKMLGQHSEENHSADHVEAMQRIRQD